ncbi:MAG: NAD-dependent epimerase/dehydratase family protein [Myxococcota bacterium]|nr:NAD-dependent epimerase/dehydratase family protein [Myxococcota bacterium]
MTTDIVLVTGATGFIALHICLNLLEAGYRVGRTVRNPSREKARYLTNKLFAPRGNDFEVVRADPQAMNHGAADCKRDIIHHDHQNINDMVASLRSDLVAEGFYLPRHTFPYWVLKCMAFFQADAKVLDHTLGPVDGKVRKFYTHLSKNELGIEYRPIRDSVRHSIDSFRRVGFLS